MYFSQMTSSSGRIYPRLIGGYKRSLWTLHCSYWLLCVCLIITVFKGFGWILLWKLTTGLYWLMIIKWIFWKNLISTISGSIIKSISGSIIKSYSPRRSTIIRTSSGVPSTSPSPIPTHPTEEPSSEPSDVPSVAP